jgi:tRNA-Thr(GGU) m(6)t(6)A37 methyltransferase TsaA
MAITNNLKEPVRYHPIGYIFSDHQDPKKVPIQPVFASGCTGRVEVFPQYEEGLADLDGFSHIHLIYHFHRARPYQAKVVPFLGDTEKGLFATRAPHRPNPIGLSLVKLIGREGNILYVDELDVLNSTPLLDIKPYITRFDYREKTRSGWQDSIDDKTAQLKGRRDFT